MSILQDRKIYFAIKCTDAKFQKHHSWKRKSCSTNKNFSTLPMLVSVVYEVFESICHSFKFILPITWIFFVLNIRIEKRRTEKCYCLKYRKIFFVFLNNFNNTALCFYSVYHKYLRTTIFLKLVWNVQRMYRTN